MTRSEITADLAVDDQADPGHVRSARALVQGVRWRSGLSQDEFSRAFCIPLAQLAALELGQARADPALTAYLRVIDHAPDVVREALERV
jgi:DNA-binding transcriptional regulator YiaG